MLTQTLHIQPLQHSDAPWNGQFHHQGRGQALSSRLTCGLVRLRPLRRGLCVVAAASPPEKEPPGSKPSTLVEKTVTGLVQRQFDEATAKKVLANLEKLGVEKPEQLRKLFINRGVTQLLSRAVRRRESVGEATRIFPQDSLLSDTLGFPPHRLLSLPQISAVLNGAAAYTAFLSFDLSRRTDELGYFQRFVESVCFTVGLNYGLVFLSELFTLASIAVAALLFGANVDVFLAAMRQTAGAREGGAAPPGFGALDAVRDAVNAVRVVETLTNIRELLRAEAGPTEAVSGGADGDVSSRSTFLNLAALLAVTNGSKAMRHPDGTTAFADNEWHISEAEAVRIARVFAKYDTPVLDVRALQKLTQELGQPLNEEEARLAMTFLDENGNGVIDYMEFVAWWAGSRSLPSAAPASSSPGGAQVKVTPGPEK